MIRGMPLINRCATCPRSKPLAGPGAGEQTGGGGGSGLSVPLLDQDAFLSFLTAFFLAVGPVPTGRGSGSWSISMLGLTSSRTPSR